MSEIQAYIFDNDGCYEPDPEGDWYMRKDCEDEITRLTADNKRLAEENAELMKIKKTMEDWIYLNEIESDQVPYFIFDSVCQWRIRSKPNERGHAPEIRFVNFEQAVSAAMQTNKKREV